MNATQEGRPSYLYHLNQSRILRFIRASGKISRNHLALKTGLSIPTISHALQNLEKQDLVESFERKRSGKKGGRPPEMFRFPAHRNYAVGIDLEKDVSSCILSDMSGKIRDSITADTPDAEDLSEVTGFAVRCIERMKKKIPPNARLRGVGISVPGLVNRQKGTILYSHTFGWKQISLSTLIRKKTGVPVFIDNEANLLSLGELYFGSGNIYRNFICVDIRFGIGCGIVYQHRLLDIPGELGQLCLNIPAQKDRQKSLLTLEERASDHAILQKAEEVLQNTSLTTLLSSFSSPLTLNNFLHALRENDGQALEIFNQALSDIGVALSFLVNIFHPEAFIFHGPLTENNPLFYSNLRRVIETCSISPFSASLDLKPSQFKNLGGAVGAVSLILNELMDWNPALFSNT
jgi:N-acetylglucosamine repressor